MAASFFFQPGYGRVVTTGKTGVLVGQGVIVGPRLGDRGGVGVLLANGAGESVALGVRVRVGVLVGPAVVEGALIVGEIVGVGFPLPE